jgi:predicted phosphodiesterase
MSDLSLEAALVGEMKDDEVIKEAERRGYVIHKPRPPEDITTTLDLGRLEGRDRIRFGVVSCTHFGSKYQQVTALHEFAAYCKEQGVDYLIHGGDVEDGPTSRHKNPHEVWLHEFDSIVDYVVEQGLPDVGIPWKMISGNHDDWWLLDGGGDICKAIAEQRDDVEYLGRSQGYLKLGRLLVKVIHINAGSSYAYSYKLQKHIESLAGGQKPHVVLMGNFHKFCAVYYRNTFGIQLPAFQTQTQWMRTKSLVSEVGGVIVDVGLDAKGMAPISKLEVVYTYEPRENDWPKR